MKSLMYVIILSCINSYIIVWVGVINVISELDLKVQHVPNCLHRFNDLTSRGSWSTTKQNSDWLFFASGKATKLKFKCRKANALHEYFCWMFLNSAGIMQSSDKLQTFGRNDSRRLICCIQRGVWSQSSALSCDSFLPLSDLTGV